MRKTQEKSQKAQQSQSQNSRGRKITKNGERTRTSQPSLFLSSPCLPNLFSLLFMQYLNTKVIGFTHVVFAAFKLYADQYNTSSTSLTNDSMGEEFGQSPPYPHVLLSGPEQECWVSVRRRRYSSLPRL